MKGKLKKETERRSNQRGKSNYTRYFLNLGVTDGLKPTQLIGMINDFTGMRDIEIGEIEILKTFSFFEADTAFQNEIIEGFKGQKLKKRDINLEIAEKRRGGGGGQVEANRDSIQIEKVLVDLKNQVVFQEIKKNLVIKKILNVKVVFQEIEKVETSYSFLRGLSLNRYKFVIPVKTGI